MTHDELIRTLKSENFRKSRTAETPYFALRAVVELHKPSEKNYAGEFGCMGCGYNSEYSTWEMEYPCPTIQAIERELSV